MPGGSLVVPVGSTTGFQKKSVQSIAAATEVL
jgi:hypothetical protein